MGVTASRVISDDHGVPLRSVVYGYTTQDGVEHSVGPVLLDSATDPALDLVARQTHVWRALVDKDIQEAIRIVKSNGLVAIQKSGGDPTVITAKYALAIDIYPALFDWWLTAPTLEAQALVPAIDAVTDATLTAMIPGINATQIAAIRNRTNTLRPINAALIADGGV